MSNQEQSGICKRWRLALCAVLMLLTGVNMAGGESKHQTSLQQWLYLSDTQGYMLTVCDHLRRTLKGKTPVVLYINGQLHLAGDHPQQRSAACIDGIFATTPGKAIFARRLYG